MDVGRDQVLHNLSAIRSAIDRASARVSRDPGSVRLVAAAKTQPAERIRWVVRAGVTAVGQNYVRELRDVRDAVPGARWHYIGALQTNSAHHVAALADVVETLSGERATNRLARRAAEAGRRPDALIEVDLTGERVGVRPEDAAAFADRVAGLEGVRLRGLMAIAPAGRTPEDARPWFRRMRELRDSIARNHPDMVDLSMGMSLDYEVAVEEGATMIRIGTALFGARGPREPPNADPSGTS